MKEKIVQVQNSGAFQRSYDGGETWEDVTESETRDKLSGYFTSVDEILGILRDGDRVQTPWAIWRYWTRKGEQK